MSPASSSDTAGCHSLCALRGHIISRGKIILSVIAAAILCTACTNHRIAGEETDIPVSRNDSIANDNIPPVAAEGADPDNGTGKPLEKGFTKEVLYDLLVAELAGQRNRLPVAVSGYLDAAIASRDTAIAKRATHLALFAEDWEQGLQAAELWMELDPEAMAAKQAYAALLVRTGRIDEALPVLRILMNHLDLPPEQKLLAVSGLLSQGEDKAATLAAMERMVAEHAAEYGDEPRALFVLAHFLIQIKKEEQAIGLLERVIAMDGRNPMARVYYAQLLHSRGDTAKALDTLEDALAKGVEHQDIRVNLAKLLIGLERYEEARKQLERLVASVPDNTEIRYTLVLLLLETGHANKARKHLRYLIDREDLTQEAYFNLGKLAESPKDIPMAMDAYRKVTHGQDYLNAQLRIVALLAKQEDLTAARAHLHDILSETEADSIRLYRMDGLILTEAGNFAQAMSVYDAALEEYPQSSDLLYARAMLAGQMGQISILERDLVALLSREPDHADALNALGYTLADQTDRYQEAMTMIQRALGLQPDSYYILDSMGWVLYRLGRYRESIDYLRRALAIQQDPEVAAHLGEVLWVTGDREAARDIWNAALEKAPDDEFLLKVMERFGQ
ncbi:MAG: Lipopolysaccharide biosynthesis regulator YciM, contains six TPR domains and a predicted metal-binding C-terminal domain [Candidatus Kentron sp. G]|nr:MAG: Lipopolysaccharide biosynthesis regulator YciM, contains six TPR domains and a predicted metal-binding C-terminal domain [Candidatus Kentron sp. G]VFM97044.1 MAG: Lipopolysaccharide biosynthesis regulator YciM, contains six TPR domains and a predicted metal-binding C-terminal domain [Candidatus Kentron sp. G]VFM99373.1 MAG: Lipopolysaccharide biosynthesis regulator YciM, contains six TPR domains and a predicted metal-binding C-terminal domain [Candidatus Kentron sp. G]